MNVDVKKRLILWFTLGLIGYCIYRVVISCQIVLSEPESIPLLVSTFWVTALLSLAGFCFYSAIAFSIHKNSITDKTIRWLQLFSGLFAGGGTIPLWFWLFPDVAGLVFTGSFYQWLFVRSLPSVVAIVVAVGITHVYFEGVNCRRLIISFAATALLFALMQLCKKVGIAHIDIRLLIAGIGFGALAYFFPPAARMLVNMAVILFVGIFAIVGGIFNKHSY